MSKGTEAISILQRYFGERVDPGKALALMMAKIQSQNELIGHLKNMLCAGAMFDGMVAGAGERAASMFDLEPHIENSTGAMQDIEEVLALPRCELRAETVETTQQPPRLVRLQ